MKIAKILSAAAACSVAAAAMAVSASAQLTTVDQTGIFKSGTGSWMPVVYSDGTFDASEKDVTDPGFDCREIAIVEVTFTPAEPEWWEGEVGGAIVLSNKSADDSSHNWNGKEFWGVIDEDLEIETLAPEKPVQAVKTGDLQYTLTMNVDDTNNVVDNYALVQVAFQEWSAGMTDITVLGMTLKDASGNVLVSYDANGNATTSAPAAPAVVDTPEDTTPTDTTTDNNDNAASAPAAPAASDSKGSPDTGVEGVAAVAGLAVVAAGAVVLSKKRK
ncbi:MAG: NPXTG-anchored protein [Oscillospiraceae bacterium]|nr:NPXTG-anchored protein [Oscillospiraceae bacterium]